MWCLWYACRGPFFHGSSGTNQQWSHLHGGQLQTGIGPLALGSQVLPVLNHQKYQQGALVPTPSLRHTLPLPLPPKTARASRGTPFPAPLLASAPPATPPWPVPLQAQVQPPAGPPATIPVSMDGMPALPTPAPASAADRWPAGSLVEGGIGGGLEPACLEGLQGLEGQPGASDAWWWLVDGAVGAAGPEGGASSATATAAAAAATATLQQQGLQYLDALYMQQPQQQQQQQPGLGGTCAAAAHTNLEPPRARGPSSRQAHARMHPQGDAGRQGLVAEPEAHTGMRGEPARKRARGSGMSVALNKSIMSASCVGELLALVRARGHSFDFFKWVRGGVAAFVVLPTVEAAGSQPLCYELLVNLVWVLRGWTVGLKHQFWASGA